VTLFSLLGSDTKLDLSFNRNIVSLEIRHLTLYQLAPSTNPNLPSTTRSCRELVPLLSTITSELSDLTFHMWLTQEWHLDSLEWEKITDLFSTPPFLKLKRFGVHVRGIESDDVKTWILRRVKSSFIRSILDVRFESSY
jgi:hypothetical protein